MFSFVHIKYKCIWHLCCTSIKWQKFLYLSLSLLHSTSHSSFLVCSEFSSWMDCSLLWIAIFKNGRIIMEHVQLNTISYFFCLIQMIKNSIKIHVHQLLHKPKKKKLLKRRTKKNSNNSKTHDFWRRKQDPSQFSSRLFSINTHTHTYNKFKAIPWRGFAKLIAWNFEELCVLCTLDRKSSWSFRRNFEFWIFENNLKAATMAALSSSSLLYYMIRV